MSIEATEVGSLREEVARALAKADRIDICSDASYAQSSYGPRADAAIAIVLERAASICDQAAVEADEKLDLAQTEESARNFASAHATSKVLAMAIRALAEPTP